MEIKIPIVIDNKALEEAIDKRVAELKQDGDFMLVTRCRDCKYFITDAFKRTMCNRTFTMFEMQPDDFCSYAEPKENEM